MTDSSRPNTERPDTERPVTERLDALEARIAHQDQMIEDLNETITAQWKDIDRLKREIERLSDRVANAEQSIGPDQGDEPPPPHW